MKITESFYKRHNAEWFTQRQCITVRDIRNRGGNVIKSGEVCNIVGKRKGLAIRSVKDGKAWITGVSIEDVRLLPKESGK